MSEEILQKGVCGQEKDTACAKAAVDGGETAGGEAAAKGGEAVGAETAAENEQILEEKEAVVAGVHNYSREDAYVWPQDPWVLRLSLIHI